MAMRSPLLGAAGATLGTLATLGGITFLVSNVAMIAVRTGVKRRKVDEPPSNHHVASLSFAVQSYAKT